jgi:hypothetical protein
MIFDKNGSNNQVYNLQSSKQTRFKLPIKYILHKTSSFSHVLCSSRLSESSILSLKFSYKWGFRSSYYTLTISNGTCSGVVVEALRYKSGSIPEGAVGIFQWHNPFGCTMALRSNPPPTEMSTRCISWGKGGRSIRLTTLPPSCVVIKPGNLIFLENVGPLHACNGTALPFS